jgi:hypothetical protein
MPCLHSGSVGKSWKNSSVAMWVSTRSGVMMLGGMPVAIFTVPTEAVGPVGNVGLSMSAVQFVRFRVSRTLSLGA